MTINIRRSAGYDGTKRMVLSGNGGGVNTKKAAPQGPSIITSGLALYLDASNPTSYPGSGTTWYDLSGNGNHAAAQGAPTYTTTNGGGFTFNGASDWFDTAPNLRESYVGTGLSVSVWARATGFAAIVHNFVERGNWSNSDGYGLYCHSFNRIMGPRYFNAAGTTSLTTSTNYFVTFTIDPSGNAKVFLNGMQEGSTATGVAVPSSSGVSPLIARGYDSGYYFPWFGDIYEVHIYGRGLSDAEVLSNFNSTKTRFGL